MTKFCVRPGLVKSINDGDMHFVGYRSLLRLYNVDPAQCHRYNEYHCPKHCDAIRLVPLRGGHYFDANERWT